METRITDDIFKQMTRAEQFELAGRGISGTMVPDKNGDYIVLMSMYGLKRLREYEDQMIEKYGRKFNNNS